MASKNSRILRFIKRFLIISTTAIFFLLLLSLVLFRVYKDDIAYAILQQANKMQAGEITIDDISFNPFIHFPDVSVDLENAKYFEKSSNYREFDTIPIINLEHFYLAFDVIDLIKGNLNASKIRLAEGDIKLITYADSTLNLMNAIGSVADNKRPGQDSGAQKQSGFELNLNRISIQNVTISYKNITANTHSSYRISSLAASFVYNPDVIQCDLASTLFLEEVSIAKRMTLIDKQIKVISSVGFDRNSKLVRVDPSSIFFENAKLKTHGFISLSNEGFVDLELTGDDKDFSFLDIFLSVDGIENVKKGDLFFNGSIKGKLQDGIPDVDCAFGMSDVLIEIPNTGDEISELDMKGTFHSGKKADFSEAQISISQLSGKLPGGKVDGDFFMKDFTAPDLNLDFYLKSDITGFENVFDLGELDSLSGVLECKSKISLAYDVAQKKFINKSGNLLVKFDSISLNIPQVNNIRNLHGRLKFESDTLRFTDLNADFGTSDFNINGELRNVLFLFIDSDTIIDGNLHIKSNTYDYPDFFSYDEKIASAFPYKIKDVNLFVRPATSTKQLKEFVKTPAIIFNIDHLDAEIENFLPPVTIHKGVFDLGEQDSSLLLNFKEFDISLAGSKLLLTNMIYTSPPVDPDWFTIDLNVANLDPKQTFAHWFSDTIPEFMDGQLDGQIELKMVLSNDSLIDFDELDIKSNKLDYVNTRDTFDIYQLNIDTEDIAYDLSASSNIMESLSFEMDLTIATLNTNYFKISEVEDEIVAKEGVYEILPHNSQLFDQAADGLITLSPFTDPPTYDFKYKVEQFDVATLFETFLEDTVATGKMDIDFELSFAGQGWDEIKKNLNGKIDAKGSDLNLIGLNLDKVIERFKRSQRFTFADVGAMFLLGPAGILVTKGADYASLVVLSPGDSSHVRQLSSLWLVEDGKINLSDVAFSTDKNRMAAIGFVDLPNDSLNVYFSLLNEDGCSVFTQGATGTLEAPKMGKVKVVESLLLAPVTNVVKSMDGKDCEVFYDGRVKQPGK